MKYCDRLGSGTGYQPDRLRLARARQAQLCEAHGHLGEVRTVEFIVTGASHLIFADTELSIPFSIAMNRQGVPA